MVRKKIIKYHAAIREFLESRRKEGKANKSSAKLILYVNLGMIKYLKWRIAIVNTKIIWHSLFRGQTCYYRWSLVKWYIYNDEYKSASNGEWIITLSYNSRSALSQEISTRNKKIHIYPDTEDKKRTSLSEMIQSIYHKNKNDKKMKKW